MIDVVKYLQKYPDDPAAVMSKARVEEAVSEIERLRAESVVNRHIISCLREEIRLEREARQVDEEQIGELLAERDELRAELAASQERLDAYDMDGAAAAMAVKAAEAERDALRTGLATKHQQYVEANEARIDANDALGNIRGLLWEVDEELAGCGHLQDGRLRRRVHSAIKNIGKLLEDGEQYE